MKTSQNGINLIKSFEGCRLQAYKAVPTEKYWTIGYGHYGADVKQGMVITQGRADAYLVSDLGRFEAKVNKYVNKYGFTQNQFDALVSFAYNVGSIDQLTAMGTRSLDEIARKILSYDKSGGMTLAGLTRRRKAEQTLFLKDGVTKVPESVQITSGNGEKSSKTSENAQSGYSFPVLRKGSKGDSVKELQTLLNYSSIISNPLKIDGVFGALTEIAVIEFQKIRGLKADGIVGPRTWTELTKD